ncbi:hypothetical protein pb186bvf_009580 [Paramecium bursaria]
MFWETLPPDPNIYSARTGHTVIAHKEAIYVFGGIDEQDRQNDVYKYQKSWIKLKTQGDVIPARSGAVACAYDDYFYFFGGYTWKQGDYFNDLFRFNPNGNIWEKLNCINPPPARVDHSFINYKNIGYLFGGSDGFNRSNDLYEINFHTLEWKQINCPLKPSNRSGHTSIFTNQLYIFGGWDGDKTLNDLWVYDKQKFKILETQNPPAGRYRHTAVEYNQNMIVFGGIDQNQERFNDLHYLSLIKLVWHRVVLPNSPTPRSFHKCVVINKYMYLLGGFDGQRRNDTYRIKLEKQIEVQSQEEKSEKPHLKWMLMDVREKFSPRTGHAACIYQNRIYIFGGIDYQGVINNDLQVFDGNSWIRLYPVGYALQPRSGAKMISLEDCLLIFGGYRRGDLQNQEPLYYNELVRYIVKENKLVLEQLSLSPLKRTDHSMTEHNGSVFIFGGTSENKQILGDLWKFKKEWKKMNVEFNISHRFGHTANTYQNSMFIFGGWDGINCLDDLYEYSYVSNIMYEIRRYSGCKPKPRYRHECLVYNDDMYVFGGVDYQQIRYNDLHQYNFRKRQWSKITTTGVIPSARTFHKFVNIENHFFIIGGIDGIRLNDMHWIMVNQTDKLKFQTLQMDESMNQADEVETLKEQVRELSRKIQKEEEKHLCKICFSRQIDSVLMECCHFILCYSCSESLKNCPVCRQKITKVIRTSMY